MKRTKSNHNTTTTFMGYLDGDDEGRKLGDDDGEVVGLEDGDGVGFGFEEGKGVSGKEGTVDEEEMGGEEGP